MNRRVYLSDILRQNGMKYADTRLDSSWHGFEWHIHMWDDRGQTKDIRIAQNVDLVKDVEAS